MYVVAENTLGKKKSGTLHLTKKGPALGIPPSGLYRKNTDTFDWSVWMKRYECTGWTFDHPKLPGNKSTNIAYS